MNKQLKRLLIYNWAPIDQAKAGGVSVYVQNLVEGLLKEESYDIYYLNSGCTYDLSCKTRIERRNSIYGEAIKAFEIVNSPFMAPITQSGTNIKKYLHNSSVGKLFRAFVVEHSIDIIHFNNFEGLPLSAITIKKDIPKLKVLYSVHNYFPLCSRVDLWQKGHICSKQSFEECRHCYEQRNYWMTRLLRAKDIKGLSRISKAFPSRASASVYESFFIKTIDAINQYCDKLLAVSERVKMILLSFGVKSDIVDVSYIGTKVAGKQLGACRTHDYSYFHIAYMGYMREEKGFYFFIDALERMPENLARNIKVSIIARHNPQKDKEELERIRRVGNKFREIKIINGYTPKNQEELLKDVHLGVVPVLWEDNLPQVAIEQIAYGVPIIVSDVGGAKELCNNSDFVFRAGDVDDFISKVKNIIDNKELLDGFWINAMRLVTINQHIFEVRKHYDE